MTIAAYTGSLSGGFVYEDERGDAPPIVLAETSPTLGPRWLTTLTYDATTSLWDASATAARVVSLGWHLLNGVLLWLVARRTVSAGAAVLAAGLFLLLPLQTEAVAGIAYRSDVMSATGLLLGLWCASRGWIAAAWLCAAGAVLGKEAGIVALALVPLWPGPRWSRRQRIGWIVASALPFAALLAWFPAHQVPLARTVADMGIAAAAYTRLLGYGAISVLRPDVLTIDHDWSHLQPEMGLVGSVGAVAVLLCVLRGWWRNALAWVAVALSLRIVLPLPEFHERQLYLASIAACVAMGAALFPQRT